VRVHTDDQAASQVARMGAEAFTTGPNIVFGPGRYQPETPAGQALIGHELTHVIQQASLPSLGGGRIAEVSAQGQALEREAIHNEGLILRHLSNTPSVGQALQPAIAAVNSFAQSQSAPSLVERSLASFEPSHLRIENGGRNENGSFNGVVERVVNPSSNSGSSGTVQRVNGQEGSNHHDGADHHEGSDKEKEPDMEELAKKVLQMLKQELIIERERQGWNNSRYF